MMALALEIRTNIKYLYPGARGERELNKDMKKMLKKTLLYWHMRFAPKHFSREAYVLYPSQYPGPGRKHKRKGEAPLVKTGTLRGRVLARKSIYDLKGTSTRARLVLKFGRPSGMSKSELEDAIRTEMRKLNISYKAAERKVYAKAGYGADNVRLFKDRIEVIAGREENAMAKYMEKEFVDKAKVTGRWVTIK